MDAPAQSGQRRDVDGVFALGFPRRSPEQRTLPEEVWRWVVRRLYRDQDIWVDDIDVVNAPIPRSVGAEAINICNARCEFCGYGREDDHQVGDPRIKQKLKPEVFRHLLDIFSKAGGGNFSLSPILGEVSAHPKWLDMVREARSYPNITGVSCFTNAILLHRFGYDEIIRSGLTHINISTCLTSRDDYRRIYGVDKYDQMKANVFGLLEANKAAGKAVDIDLLLRMDKPFDVFFDGDVYRRLAALIDRRKIAILDDEWDDFKGLIKPSGLPIGHSFKPIVRDKTTPCYALFRKLEVLTDGTIQACACRVEPELWGGNILDHADLESAWRDPGLEKIRADWFAGKIPDCCRRCSHYIPFTNLIASTQPKAVAKRILGKLGWGRLASR